MAVIQDARKAPPILVLLEGGLSEDNKTDLISSVDSSNTSSQSNRPSAAYERDARNIVKHGNSATRVANVFKVYRTTTPTQESLAEKVYELAPAALREVLQASRLNSLIASFMEALPKNEASDPQPPQSDNNIA